MQDALIITIPSWLVLSAAAAMLIFAALIARYAPSKEKPGAQRQPRISRPAIDYDELTHRRYTYNGQGRKIFMDDHSGGIGHVDDRG